ncbi:hypothetical protein KVR01_004231 [Diaporthe batatas]|uniref:uncharacterized protein n=1 Tax=Diaporthe batatas TaxID=748121 RepID=UPI001D041FF5|nr:uncharacterized protein KVR01_004231 [Diaporthe batatas]KAG8165679.1 hypothetical protein KVR01_004231 [Diaporthe batatas]
MFVWANVEVNFGVVAACAPLLRPLFSMYTVGQWARSDKYEPHKKRFFGGNLHASRKQEKLQDSVPSLLISTRLNSKKNNASRNSTTDSSQTRSMMESRATVHPVSVLDDPEYYQVPVMIPETVLETPEHMATEENFVCQERSRLKPIPGVEDIEGMSWDIWAGPTDNIPNLPKPPRAVYPGDASIEDSPNLRFLTVHHIV